MVKIIATLSRKEGRSEEEFVRYWREEHSPLVARLPHLRRYVINPVVETQGETRPFDGVAELWFDDREAFEESMKTPERNAARADLPNFVDMEKMTRAIVEERRVV